MFEPTRLGRYVLLERIAVGGMAELFFARDAESSSRDPVCIKRIRSHLDGQPEFVNMFLNEARLAAELQHPNIVRICNFGQADGGYFIAMEYVNGCDMNGVLKKAEKRQVPFHPFLALQVAARVCDALHYAHTFCDAYQNPLGIVHRDVSPHNILLAFDGSVKLSDFGIAKASSALSDTRTGQIKGKLRYMSPEQLAGGTLDGRSDIFSLGVALHEWMTSCPLFTGDSEMAVMKSIREDRIYAPSYYNPNIDSNLDAIVMRALERNRDRRYPSALAMRHHIEEYLASQGFEISDGTLGELMIEVLQEEWLLVKARLALNAPALEQAHEAKPVADGKEIIAVHLSDSELVQLSTLAKRHQVAPENLIEQWIRDRLRWL